jgi:ubiquinone/menaquinone biosynthesis C-methylase UbiE
MEVKEAYNQWAEQYDTNQNKTRDLEAVAIRETLAEVDIENCLEIGCGTGKNTKWLATKVKQMLAVDLSDEMLAKAKIKINDAKIEFKQANILDDWHFAANKQFELVTFSLVLEHIKDLNLIFDKLGQVVKENGYVYIGELHPFKQYNGTKARFDTMEGRQVVTCFNHNISDFITPAKKNKFEVVQLNEYFDDDNHENIPRILALLLKKKIE